MLVIGQLEGQLTCHACVSGQNTPCVHAFVSHFAKLIVAIVVVVFFYGNVHITDVWFLSEILS